MIKVLLSAVLTLCLATGFGVSPADAETRIASWNIKRMTAENKDMNAVARVISHFDLVAIQEIMDETSIAVLLAEVQALTGTEWGYMPSHAIGRGSYKEHYAFVWRKTHVQYVDSAVVYLDSKDVFAREPLSARFRTADNETFIAANIHVLYGDSKSDRIPEIKALAEYWGWLGETFPDEQYFLMGDFNMAPDDVSWSALKQVASPVVTEGGSTLSTKNGVYANLYDNIWVPNNISADIKASVFPLPTYLEMSNRKTRDTVSDHAPVYMVIDNIDQESGRFDPELLDLQEQSYMDPVRANKNSKIYHLPSCGSYADMANSKNLEVFTSVEMAVDNGYRAAQNCS